MEAAHLLKSQAALKVDPSHKKKKKIQSFFTKIIQLRNLEEPSKQQSSCQWLYY